MLIAIAYLDVFNIIFVEKFDELPWKKTFKCRSDGLLFFEEDIDDNDHGYDPNH